MDMEEPEPTIFCFLPKKWKRRFFGLPLLPYVEVLCGGGVPNFLKRGGGGGGGERMDPT